MELFSVAKDENVEDIPGRKKSKLKSLKTRLFGKSKTSADGGGTKLSQSAGDITAGEELGSDENLACSQGMIGSRALSHDSIFLADQVETDTQQGRVLSQENVKSKIKALQMKLQQQKMHLGPPPIVLPIRRQEHLDPQSEGSKPNSPPEMRGEDNTSHGFLFKMMPTRPLSPTPRPPTTKSLSPTPSHSVPLSVSSNAPHSSFSVEPPLDFSTPAQFTSCLDSSAARHRMLVKPRNQRASTKKKLTGFQDSSESEAMNSTEHFEPVKEAEQQLHAHEEAKEDGGHKGADISSQNLPSKSAEVAVVTSAAATKPSRVSHQDYVIPRTVPSISPQVLRVKPHRNVDVMPGVRPHSSYIETEVEREKERSFEIQALSHEIRNAVNKTGLTEASNQLPASISSTSEFKPSPVHQQAQAEDKGTRSLKRPAPGSGSFHFSITSAKSRDGERPRSGSFVGVLEQIESRQKTAKENEEKAIKEKEESNGLQSRGDVFTVGKLRPDVVPPKSSVTPWDKRDSLKKVAPKNTPTPADEAGGAAVKMDQEVVEMAEEAKEVQEDEGKIAFGVKLRSTSQSIKQRSETAAEGHGQKRQATSTSNTEKLQINTSCSSSPSDQRTDPAPSGLSPPVKNHTTFMNDPPATSAKAQPTTEGPLKEQQLPHAPHASSSEVSWMSLAMEKTRSLQQLFTSRLPRDLAGMQAAGRSQAPAQPTGLTETVSVPQTHSETTQQSATQLQAAHPPAAGTVKAEAAHSRSQTETVKPSAGGQHKTTVASPDQSHAPRELQTSKQTSEDQPQINTTQCVSQSQPAANPSVQTNPWRTQCSLRSSSQIEATTQLTQRSNTESLAQAYLHSNLQQPAWSNRGLHPVNQPKSTAAAPTSTSAAASTASPVSDTDRVNREVSGHIESPSLSSRRVVWTGSVSERAAFLDRRTEWKSPPGPNEVELRKSQTEAQTSAEPPAVAKVTPACKDTVAEGRQGVKLRESSPTKIPEKLREDKWLRKSVEQTSSPSSSPTMPSVLQTMSDSGQPSWMELAKRKSMAWSDKTMD